MYIMSPNIIVTPLVNGISSRSYRGNVHPHGEDVVRVREDLHSESELNFGVSSLMNPSRLDCLHQVVDIHKARMKRKSCPIKRKNKHRSGGNAKGWT